MLIGRRINDRYKLLSFIGGGGMANVYLARDMILDRDVAIKILRLDFANEPEFIQRFHREAQSATSLVHPNIVSIYDIGEEDDINYIVMENVDGMTLKQYIQQFGPVSVEKTLDIMSQLTAAISHAHQNHIIHRDIKPQNILIDRNGVVKITDFGIAMALTATSITQTNAVLGSVHYLSPEQARGGMATYKSDIYALGIVMFELLTGRLPFSGESAVSIALKHLQSETPSPKRWNPDIPQSVENIILKATAKDPFHRYDSADQMGEDIRTALDPERINEPKFEVPEDNDKTKTIPVLSHFKSASIQEDETIILNDVESEEKKKKKKKNDKNPTKKRRRKWPWIVALLFIIFLVGGAAVAMYLPQWMGPKEVSVPSLANMDLNDAKSTLSTQGLTIGDKIKMTSDTVPKGKIIQSSPKAGAKVKEGTQVDVYVSSGKQKITFNDYVGRQFSDVVKLLSQEHFKDVKSKEVYDDAAPGTIIAQDPDADKKIIPENTVITFTVSKGLEKFPVKDLTDYTKKALDDYANESGFIIDSSKSKYSDTVKEGLVISQSPAAGTKLTRGSTIKVVLSKGPKELPPKTVKEEVTIPYEPEDTGDTNTDNTDDQSANNDDDSTSSKDDQDTKVKQQVQIFIEDMNHTMSEPVETFDITEDTKKQLEFTIEYKKQATYKIVRDGTVIAEDTVSYPD
ncbi:Stk1 family PASTA domain-containing Ser/Thr kinase [Bacillus ginsengihumi]|uniref:Serine/threonine-protein kinase PrkC n=1 Tax=Heyndrickxia ginsengihumi TaxID=363870 RepID=A0A6M0P4C4_9BACI|nr:Stk1 family PASTA domain-containing Ser/Thr kinase [Heyndrickxia ginsengihumi]NEY19566.1 Stk1 family PASTA domain-containing Ser/Thr kinase [Heyndrickxia ginsengihumi]